MKRLAPAALAFVLLALFAGVMSLEPITQSPGYHGFADQRLLFGVPNFLDVASNIGFVVVGVLGVALCVGQRRPRAASWMVFFICTLLTAFGSAYYHWAPNDATLVWDRLPISLAAMALLVAVVVEHFPETREHFLLASALVAGAASVIWWKWSGDLRPYLWVQFAPLVCIPGMVATLPARHTHRRYLLYAIGLYCVAKATELADKEIFTMTGHLVSGHTLKHLLAAAAIFVIFLMLRRREPIHA